MRSFVPEFPETLQLVSVSRWAKVYIVRGAFAY